MPITASLWLYLPDQRVWRLILASPEVESLGPIKVYAKVVAALNEQAKEGPVLPALDITVVTSFNRLVRSLSSVVHTGGGIAGIRFSRNVVEGEYIDDAYIYRLSRAGAPAA